MSHDVAAVASRQNLVAIDTSLEGTGGEVGSLDVVGHGEGAGGEQGKSLDGGEELHCGRVAVFRWRCLESRGVHIGADV